MMKKVNLNKRKILLFIMVMICLGIFAAVKQCGETQTQVAEKVLTNLLNAPNEELEAAYDTLFPDVMIPSDDYDSDSGDSLSITEPDSTQVKMILAKLLENRATDTFLESCLQINEITSLQYNAMLNGFQSKLQELSIEKTQQKDTLEYDAVLSVSVNGGGEQLIHVNGLIQFNDKKEINAITLSGRELSVFYEK